MSFVFLKQGAGSKSSFKPNSNEICDQKREKDDYYNFFITISKVVYFQWLTMEEMNKV